MNRKLWGLILTNGPKGEVTGPVFTGWAGSCLDGQTPYPGEPARVLLFTTKKTATELARKLNEKWRGYPKGHVCSKWRMRPVRVSESLRMAP